MHAHIRRERVPGETRVAAIPETVKALAALGLAVSTEPGAGEGSHFLDAAFEDNGATHEGAIPANTTLLLTVRGVTADEVQTIPEGCTLVGLLAPHANLDAVAALRDRGITSLAMELVPRITRAQSMDALTSQASIAGYRAALIAALHLDKYMALMMTAAGTIKPAKVVIMGAGVAGLQAIATCRRLGAVVEVSDIRPEVKEQVESLGGRFIELKDLESGSGEGGYAKEVSEEFLQKQQAIIRERVVGADAVITTANVPGRKAPTLVTEAMVQEMREGAVIVDLAVESGGNCELTESDQVVTKHGVTLVGTANLPATLPADASRQYARNVLALAKHLVQEGELVIDPEDEITGAMLLTHGGAVTHEPTAERLTEEENG